ncbi:MAG: F0F1 ATP synthase subunit A [Pseudomonadota bacterium]
MTQAFAAETVEGAVEKAAIDPLSQFDIDRLIELNFLGLDISFTNSALFMLLGTALVGVFMMASMRGRALVPDRLQSVTELSYEFVAGLVRDNAGSEGLKYFPFVFALFMFILFLNMLGLFPYSFTSTSHIIVTLALGLLSITVVTVIGFMKHGTGFLKLFAPSGVPGWLMPILIPIEVISYLIRPFSLGVRLFANMVAGHMMIKVFAGFVILMGAAGIVPFMAMIAINALELLVAFLQAYVFAILTSIYLNDALHPHH